jgi:acetyl esterase/lipase
VIENVGIPEDRVILYGHSYGAPIVMFAAARAKLMTPLLFASVLSTNVWIVPHERCVVAFQGEADLILRPDNARQNLLNVFGAESLDEPCGHFETFPGEGHVFENPSSYARVFAAAVKMLED